MQKIKNLISVHILLSTELTLTLHVAYPDVKKWENLEKSINYNFR